VADFDRTAHINYTPDQTDQGTSRQKPKINAKKMRYKHEFLNSSKNKEGGLFRSWPANEFCIMRCIPRVIMYSALYSALYCALFSVSCVHV
jgi:hypothetical protein